MTLSRRRFLALTGAAATVTGLPQHAVAQAIQGGPAAARQAAEHTTLARRLGPEPGVDGYRRVVTLSGEPHVVRELGATAQAGRAGRRRSLLSFVHLTDQHIVDAQSTTRVEFVDRYAEEPCPGGAVSSAHRAQEVASARIADAMLQQLRRIAFSPVTGAPIGATISTGDNTDNQQANELGVFRGVMDGGRVVPQSGDPQRYEGVQRSGSADYWHPDLDGMDRYQSVYGYPHRPGWLEEALATFDAVGAGVPWYTCYGNHDGLAQGNSPVTPAYSAIATSGTKVVGGPAGTAGCNNPPVFSPNAPAMAVTADPERRYIHRKEWIEGHFQTTGVPVGHGFTGRNRTEGLAYYTADVGGVRWIVLDTVNPGGYASGNVGAAQLAWLEAELERAQSERRLVMLFSHHGPRSLDNPVQTPDPFMPPEYSDSPRHMADSVLAVVNQFTCVIAWVNGHTHNNIITERGHWWDIGTAAHIDWPCQARIVDVVDNRDGTLSIFTTMIDHADDPVAAVARELAGNDPQKGFGKGEGTDGDRNAELLLAHPFAVAGDGADDTPVAEGVGALPVAPFLPATGVPANLTLGGALMVAGAVGITRLRMDPARRA